jgi:hypothetical protein
MRHLPIVLLVLAACGDVPLTFVDGGTDQQVLCADHAPANAISIPATVTVTRSGDGWTTPAACEWACSRGFCRIDQACAADLPDHAYEVPGPTSRWFGGDDRADTRIRSVGQGQSFVLDATTAIQGVAFGFAEPFGSAQTFTPAATRVRYDLRDAAGTILQTGTVVAPASFTGGWLTAPLTATLAANTTYIVTAFVPGVYAGDNHSSGIRTDYENLYAGGTAFGIETTSADVDLTDWANWQPFPGDDYAWKLVTADACPLP